MVDPKEMTDDEFVDFINASKDRIEMLMGRGDDLRLKFKDDAKKTKAKITLEKWVGRQQASPSRV